MESTRNSSCVILEDAPNNAYQVMSNKKFLNFDIIDLSSDPYLFPLSRVYIHYGHFKDHIDLSWVYNLNLSPDENKECLLIHLYLYRGDPD